MASLVMFPSSSLPPFYGSASFATSVASSASTAAFPSSPSSTWSPSTSPLAQLHSLPSASRAATSAAALAAAPAPLPAKSLPLASPRPLVAASHGPFPATAAATVAYSMASAPSTLASTVLAQSAVAASTVTLSHLPLLPSTASQAAQQPQTFLINAMGQTFLLAPVGGVQQAASTVQPLMAQSYAQLQSTAPQQPMWMTSGGELMAVNVNGAPVQLLHNAGGQLLHLSGAPPQPHGSSQPFFLTQTTAGAGFAAAAAQAAGQATPMVTFAVPSSPLSPLPFPGQPQAPDALPALSAFHTPSKRADSTGAVVAATPMPGKALVSRQPPSTAVGSSASQLLPPHLPRRRQSSSSSSSASSSASSASSFSQPSSASPPARLSSDEVEALDALSSSSLRSPSSRRRLEDSDGDSQTPQRIDGMSSSRLLTHISKKPSHVLPFTVHRSQLPGHFDHVPSSSAPPSLSFPSSPVADPSHTVTVNIRVMGGPSVSELYFVAADLSQLIHSRKSNIAKAVSVFSDSERARCSVICPRSNQTQSTHILTVLTMDGVTRLLQSSRAAIALPFLAWINAQVQDIQQQAGKAGAKRGDREGKGGGEESRVNPSDRAQGEEGKAKKARKE